MRGHNGLLARLNKYISLIDCPPCDFILILQPTSVSIMSHKELIFSKQCDTLLALLNVSVVKKKYNTNMQ